MFIIKLVQIPYVFYLIMNKNTAINDVISFLPMPALIIDNKGYIVNANLVYKEKRPNCFSLSDFRKCIARGWYGKSRTYMSDLLIKNKSKLKFNQKSFRNK